MKTEILIAASVLIGVLTQYFLSKYLKRLQISKATEHANHLLEMANDKFEEELHASEEAAQEYAHQIQEQHEEEFLVKENKIEKMRKKLNSIGNEHASLLREKETLLKRRNQSLESLEGNYQKKLSRLIELKDHLQTKKSHFIQNLADHHHLKKEEILHELSESQIKIFKAKSQNLLEELEVEDPALSERKAKQIINVALNRFIRPYCPDRGLGFITLNEGNTEKMLGVNKENILYLEKLCGVDIIYNEKANTLSVSGFDPVRRELARLTMEKLLKVHQINEKSIQETMNIAKKELFKKIKVKGDELCKDVRIKDVHPEVKNMMGALLYRYSFTQNQFFHCGEVGHLCGLLASEVEETIADARRAGVFHDIGKTMDHSIDGGHAVIGADFIEKHGEAKHIVHAVRAHHYDEQPSTNLAYLVIGADAISGARPGARRSTAVSYVQKMDQLQEIGNSYDGVIDTFILNAGREIRVLVDSQKISDSKAMTLSKEMSQRIEHECSYPGTIRVTVVRKSQAVEYAK